MNERRTLKAKRTAERQQERFMAWALFVGLFVVPTIVNLFFR